MEEWSFVSDTHSFLHECAWWWIGLLLNVKRWVWSWRAFGAWSVHSAPFAFGTESLSPRAGHPFGGFLFFFFPFFSPCQLVGLEVVICKEKGFFYF